MTPYGLQLVEMGYRPGARYPAVEALDAEIVKRMHCRKCKKPLRYEGYHNNDTGSYVALAVCDACGDEREF